MWAFPNQVMCSLNSICKFHNNITIRGNSGQAGGAVIRRYFLPLLADTSRYFLPLLAVTSHYFLPLLLD